MISSAIFSIPSISIPKPVRCTLLAAVFLGLNACASTPTSSVDARSTPSLLSETAIPAKPTPRTLDEVALDDLLLALVQYRNPITTTLQASLTMANDDKIGLLDQLAKRGYGLQLVDADQGANLLNHSTNPTGTAGSVTTKHTLQVGRLELAREYATVNGKIRPVGPLSVAGSRRRIALDDSRFGDAVANDRLISRIAFSIASDVEQGETPRISLLQLPLATSDSNNVIGTNASGLEVSNAFFGDDNFGSILDEYEKLESVSVIFPNDSMRLGNIGRLKIDVFLGEFDEDSDLIRVVGCSNGKTNVAIGNEGLALGRAERVTQELLARGVTREHILDEGCWAPTSAGDRFPSRGVLLEMYRES